MTEIDGAVPATAPGDVWHKTACVLCSLNCGIEVRLDGRRITRVRGDKDHPASKGYTCEKALRIDHYQNGRDRLTAPLRRRDDGTFEEVDWDTAIAEVAGRLAAIRDAHGGDKILYYGGGGQGNHLPGAHARAVMQTLGMRYRSNALAQEKTGMFWVQGRLFGRQSLGATPDLEHTDCAVFVGKNPWQSHGFPASRNHLNEMKRDDTRSIVVIDPRLTETAAIADVHLRVRPGGDAWLLAALLGVMVDEDLVDAAFVDRHCHGWDELRPHLAGLPIATYAERAGVAEEEVRAAARLMAAAASMATEEDLGIEMAPHSTLNSYLQRLLYLLTGNFAVPGGMNLPIRLAPLVTHTAEGAVTPVTGERIISGLVPCNALPDEIVTDHPDRFRAMIVESANPAHTLADTKRIREALDALELLVVVDVAMTETCRHADYVLPAASQYEKAEATFFAGEVPANWFHLRRPVLEPLGDTLAEPEIHARLTRALGGMPPEVDELAAAARQGRREFVEAFGRLSTANPDIGAKLPVVLQQTIGRSLPPGMQSAGSLFGACVQAAMRFPSQVNAAGIEGEGLDLAAELFDSILDAPSGLVVTVSEHADSWDRIAHDDGRIHLSIPELYPELDGLADEDPRVADADYPYVLSAGERRSSNANTVVRDPSWRKRDPSGALRVHPADATELGLLDGGRTRVESKRGQVEAVVEITDTVQRGHVTLPHGFGMEYPDEVGEIGRHGPAVNELTAVEDRDWLALTPFHKHVRVRLEPIPG